MIKKNKEEIRAEPLPYPFQKSCFIGLNIFSETECKNFISRIQDPLKIDTTTSEDVQRIVERTSLKDATLADFLYERVASLCPAVWHVTEEDKHLGPFAQGEWEIDSVDHRIQLYKYTAGGIFKKHRDGPTYHSVDKRSLFTVLVYLNMEYTGGYTTVWTDDLTHEYKVPHMTGGCFVMLQRILHEGGVVEQGNKYALRCDVLYRRRSGTAYDVVRHLDKKEQAKKWFQLASCLELSGCYNESVVYYQRAYKLDPDLQED
eukprot:TRINITY_DN5866_c0_g2_i1.p1 TRINITY_DN5866_c0_g2~~TRINITY_DN5866_c0_g2_i1.p1  ORF type:complete len:260 (-),score=32.59 TRINITY_DN5866_c0_g2_i1:152-931(-)